MYMISIFFRYSSSVEERLRSEDFGCELLHIDPPRFDPFGATQQRTGILPLSRNFAEPIMTSSAIFLGTKNFEGYVAQIE
jgi:hypothetical protein